MTNANKTKKTHMPTPETEPSLISRSASEYTNHQGTETSCNFRSNISKLKRKNFTGELSLSKCVSYARMKTLASLVFELLKIHEINGQISQKLNCSFQILMIILITFLYCKIFFEKKKKTLTKIINDKC